ncbi:hypothetical protein [Clostridium sp.]|uniref:hypothetical protein n=1 Tax=Clostridium sp. TaxID=1506 RepID=UPI003216F0AA
MNLIVNKCYETTLLALILINGIMFIVESGDNMILSKGIEILKEEVDRNLYFNKERKLVT